MKIVGITGGIGAGKSTVCREFENLGAKIIDADEISRNAAAKNGCAYSEIVDYFGKEILLENGEINRRYLAEIVFSDKDKLAVLNDITHKHVFAEMRKRINEADNAVVVLDVPLLFSSDFDIECDLKIAILADDEVRIERVKKRDGLCEDEIRSRMRNQISNTEYENLADICIVNNDLEQTKEQVKKIYESLRG